MRDRKESKQPLTLVPERQAPQPAANPLHEVIRSLLGMHRAIEARLNVLLKPETMLPAATLGTVIRSCIEDFHAIHRMEARQVFPELQGHALEVATGSGRLSARMQIASLSRRLISLLAEMSNDEAAVARVNLLLARSMLKKTLLIRHRHFYQPLLAAASTSRDSKPAATG